MLVVEVIVGLVGAVKGADKVKQEIMGWVK